MNRNSRARRRQRGGGTRAVTPPRYGPRGHWGYMGNSPVGMHPSSPQRDISSPENEGLDALIAAFTEEDDHYEIGPPLLSQNRESRIDFSGLMSRMLPTQSRAGAATPAPGGYPEDMFTDLTDKEKELYECNICFYILQDPRECPNKHLFCATCIYKWSVSQADSRSTCPVCRVYGRYMPSKDADSFLLHKHVRCQHEECDWSGILREYKLHRKSHDKVTVAEPKEPRSLPALVCRPGLSEHLTREPPLAQPPLPARDLQDRDITLSRAVTTQQRIQQGRERIQNMLAQVRTEMEEHRQHVEQFQQERERQRQTSLHEVHHIGDQLEEVADGLIVLLDDLRVDRERCNHYIRALRRGDALPEIARNVAMTQSQRRRPYRTNPSSSRSLPTRVQASNEEIPRRWRRRHVGNHSLEISNSTDNTVEAPRRLFRETRISSPSEPSAPNTRLSQHSRILGLNNTELHSSVQTDAHSRPRRRNRTGRISAPEQRTEQNSAFPSLYISADHDENQ